MRRIHTVIASLLLVALLCLPALARGADTAVTVPPFAVHGAPEYLGSGLASMVASRLGVAGGIRVVDSGADYTVRGSITGIGGRFSIDVRLEPVKGGAARSFFAAAGSEADILTAVDDLSARLREAISGAAGAQKAAVPAAGKRKADRSAADIRNQHPEKDFIAAAPVPAPLPSAAAAPAPAAAGKIVAPKRFDKTANIKFAASAMTMGDVDGDGEDEVIFASPAELRVYRLAGRDLKQVADFRLPARIRMHFIDTLDLDNDGRAEILVSGNDEWAPSSAILSLGKDGKLQKLAGPLPWFIRALRLADGSTVLAGQKAGFDHPLAREIHRLGFSGGELRDGGRIALPLGLNIFAMTLADVDGDGKKEIVAADQQNKLSVYRMDGRRLWRSSEDFAGVNRFLGGDRETAGFTEGADVPAERVYLSTRIEAADLNGDGVDEVVVNRTTGALSRLMARSRSYSGGEINVLAWNGIGLTPVWKGPVIDGYVLDNVLAGGKGAWRVAVGVLLKTGWLGRLGADECAVLFFDLGASGR